MWGIDDADGAAGSAASSSTLAAASWLGRAAVIQALSLLRTETGHTPFALSYRPDNVVARRLYASLGFVETGEEEDGELVARLSLG